MTAPVARQSAVPDVQHYVMTPADVTMDVVAFLERAAAGDWGVVQTGAASLDDEVSMYPGSLTAVLGRPSHGKSMFLKSLCRRELARIAGVESAQDCVVYVTLEELPAAIGISLGGWRLTLRDLAAGNFDLERRRLDAAQLARHPLFLVRHPGLVNGRLPPALTPRLLYQAIAAIAQDYPSDPDAPRYRPSLVLLDYLQLLHADDLPTSEGAKVAQVTAAVEGAKALSLRLDVPVVMAVQAGREADRRDGQLPALADAQWASAIEQACDIVLAVHRPCRRPDFADALRLGERVTITVGGRAKQVTDSLMIVSVLKQRFGVGYGRHAVCIDPVGLELYEV